MTDTVLLLLLVAVVAFSIGFVIRRGKPSRGKFDLIVPHSAFRRPSRPAGNYSGQGHWGSAELAGRRMRYSRFA
jgi:hypothetical protein